MNESIKNWLETFESATSVGQHITKTIDEFDLGLEHIVQLLTDASILLESGSHANSIFLAITALEETAKMSVEFRRHNKEQIPRKKDPLFQHGKKHLIAVKPTIAMGSRLQKAIGEQRMLELINQAWNGGFISIREASLYIDNVNGQLKIPSSTITKDMARELLLFAIESFDDGLVGLTNRSFELGKETDQVFIKWQNP